jgi:anti-anti-sigma factor
VTATDLDPPSIGEKVSVETVDLDPLRAFVRVTGDLDVSTAATLWAVLQGHLAAGRKHLRLDLAGVALLDSCALSGIVQIHHEALELRGTLVLSGVNPHVANVLRMTGVDDVLFLAR